MKKLLIIFFVFCTLNFFVVEARDMYEKKLPSKFKKECFEFSTTINFKNKNNWEFIVNINKENAIAVRNWYLVPIIPYKIKWESFNYRSNIFENNDSLIDWNLKTFYEFNIENNKEIILEFNKKISANSFWFSFKHNAIDYYPVIFISKDWENFFEVSFSSLYNFDIKKFKIIFKPKYKGANKEKIKIKELNFLKEKNINLMRVKWWGIVDFYSNYNCQDYVNLSTIHIPFKLNSKTPEISIKLKKNINYNPNIENDIDLDKIDDYYDNCEEVFNPLQKDSDEDWIWDMCSDVDKDWFIGFKDNCPYVNNPDQKDLNRNNIWDKCELDKDKDWIFDSIDNCINVKNALQEDSDWDNIWDKCDNCDIFNPKQEDFNNNSIWDICDKNIEKFNNSDNDWDWINNFNDNCIEKENKEQLDSDKDWIWDKCDNCINVQNKNQLDFNKNGIWDFCEDSDKDWVKWKKDNCINLFNPKQLDSNNNWIWNKCEDEDKDNIWFAVDNCPNTYNPRQLDINKNWIWDECDDNNTLKSDNNIFVYFIWMWMIVFLILLYLTLKLIDWKNKKINIKNINKKDLKNKKNKTEFEFLNWESYTKKKKGK